MFRSPKSTSLVAITLYWSENFCWSRRLVSSVSANVGTIINTFRGFIIEIYASIMKLFPKLVGALTAKFSPFSSLLSTEDCSRCSVIGFPIPTSTLNAS
ncbi:hypothetical protein BGLA2_420117 [Burkholderia gladioli]|nr:hypothetical protein BGLA2_420117 [Burkholderia gladioli]